MTEPGTKPVKRSRAQLKADLAAAKLRRAKIGGPPPKPEGVVSEDSATWREWVTATLSWEAERVDAEAVLANVKDRMDTPATLYGALVMAAAATLVTAAATVSGPTLDFFINDPRNLLIVGIVIVVTLGAGGQILRGAGELRTSPKLKAYGYFAGAAAYIATASISLTAAFQLVRFGQ